MLAPGPGGYGKVQAASMMDHEKNKQGAAVPAAKASSSSPSQPAVSSAPGVIFVPQEAPQKIV